MYVKINAVDYTHIGNLTFSPQTDVIGDALPINEFECDIYTDDAITYGDGISLYDDANNLWAYYNIVYAEPLNGVCVHVRAQSDIMMLDQVTLDEIMYNGTLVSDALDDVFSVPIKSTGLYVLLSYDLDESFAQTTLTGYCPEQTARERLQWICYSIGAYVQTYAADETKIKPLPESATLVPMEKTFLRPTVSHSDYVTAVKATAYAFSQSPQTEQEFLADNTSYKFPPPWVAEEQEFSLANPAAPGTAPENIVEVDGVYLLNAMNVSGVLSRLGRVHFQRTKVDVDVINNGEYWPGQKLTICVNESTMATGYVESAAFRFGKQARSTLRLVAADTVDTANLTIIYTYNGIQLARATYLFPVGYEYTIQNPYIDMFISGLRYIFRPTTATTTGTMPAAGAEATVTCAIALAWRDDILRIVSVDNVTVNNQNVAVIS